MPAPTLSSSSPVSGATNVAKNVSIILTFDTALLPSSVDLSRVYLRYEPARQRVPASVSLSTDGLQITIVPDTLLIPNSGYKIVIVGADVSTTQCLFSAGNDALATTIQIIFQTGDTLAEDASTGVKTLAEQVNEGDSILPDDIGFRSTLAPMRLIRTSPSQHTFGWPVTSDRIRLEFTSPVDITSAEENISISVEAFYGEEDLRAITTDLGDGLKTYFQYEAPSYTGDNGLAALDVALFTDPIFDMSVTGNFLDISVTPITGEILPNNICIQLDIGAGLESAAGVPLGEDLVYMICDAPYPKWDSIQGVRHEVGYLASKDTPDDFVGLRIWRASIDLWLQLYQDVILESPGRYHQMWARVRAALDIWDDLMVSKYLNSGVVKELGDLRIQYNTGSGGAKSRKVRELEDRLEKLYRNIWGYYTQGPRIGIKSEWDNYEPTREFFRDRLWKMELAQNRGQGGLAGKIAANTAFNRKQVLASWTSTGLNTNGFGTNHGVF